MVLAIVFSLALMFPGVPLTSACVTTVPKPCCHCGGQADCCKAKTSPPAAPALPAPRSVQNDLLPAFCLTAGILALPLPAGDPTFSVSPTPPVRAVPLFTRDCAFLL
jgi:hypothetical protein